MAALTVQTAVADFSVYVSAGGEILHAEFADGRLTEPAVALGQGAGWLAPVPQAPLLLGALGNYPRAEGPANGGLASFRILEDGSLERVDDIATQGKTPCYVDANRFGVAAVANFRFDTGPSRGSVFGVRFGETGEFKEATAQRFEHPGQGGGGGPRQEASHPHSAVFSPDGLYLAVGDLGVDKVVIYGPNPASGGLEQIAEARGEDNQQPRHVGWHPNGEWLYVMNEVANTVSALRFNADARQLEFFQHIERPGGAGADLKVHPGGRFVYGSVRGSNALVCYAVDAESGELAQLGVVATGGGNCRSFAISPDGRHLITANQGASNLTVFAIGDDGMPQPTGQVVEATRPGCVIFR
ncbi:MAG: lactonase family protein [Opitutales bacterium]